MDVAEIAPDREGRESGEGSESARGNSGGCGCARPSAVQPPSRHAAASRSNNGASLRRLLGMLKADAGKR